jgi:hypothetical protein
VVLVVVCLISITVFFSRSRETLDRISGAILGYGHVNQAAQAKTHGQEPQTCKARPSSSKLPASAAEGTPPDEIAISRPSQAPALEADKLHAKVKTDSAAVYSLNSSGSPIVHLLKKGDSVETKLEVLDSDGRWSLVQTSDFKEPGFVRSETLERAQTTAGKD